MAFSTFHLGFDDIEVGQEWVTGGRTITQTDVVNFAGISGDFNPIHIDHEFAKTTVYRQPIAHGLLVFSVASGLGVNCPPMRTMAFLRVNIWTFIEPTMIGDTIHLITRVKEKTARGRGRRGEVVWYRGVVNQHGKTVQDGEIVTLVECRNRPVAGASRSAENGPADPSTITGSGE